MKSDILLLSSNKDNLELLLKETEKQAEYRGLEKKEASRLRLLAEELHEMLPELLSFSAAKFWIESEEKKFELHTTIEPNDALTGDLRDKLLEVSSSGKNAAAKGILSKIKLAVQFMMIDYEENSANTASFYTYGLENAGGAFSVAWSLNTYKQKANADNDEKWDELERSIIANLADEVLIGLEGKTVEVIVKKAF
jgi:hypothetical protein